MTKHPKVSVLVPTHDSTWALENAVKSALNQTISDLEVLIVGDGVGKETRDVVNGLVKFDDRVRFLDLPKSPNRGEANRDLGVRSCLAENIFYLADDDLFLKNHVENLLPLLSDRDLVQSFNGYVDKDGVLALHPSDLSDPTCINWHLTNPPRNAVSITGTAHKKTSYLQLSSGWEVPPDNVWPDLHLWRKFFSLRNFRGATHSEMTTIQFPAPFRRDVSESTFREIYDTWLQISKSSDCREIMSNRVEKALRGTAVNLNMHITNLHYEIAHFRDGDVFTLKSQLDEALAELDKANNAVLGLQKSIREISLELDNANSALLGIKSSSSWKITRPLRDIKAWFRNWA